MHSSKYIAEKIGESLYKTKIILREMRKTKKINYDHFNPGCGGNYEYGCDCDNHLPIWGWTVLKFNN